MKKLIAVLLCVTLSGACATAGGPRLQRFDASTRTVQSLNGAAPLQAVDKALLAEYVQKLPLGTKVRVDRLSGGAIHGTLMKATGDYVVVQRRTRLPEPPEQIALEQITGITPQSSSSVGKAIAIGAGAGAAAALGTILILIAIFSD